jgi:hypothetical protein
LFAREIVASRFSQDLIPGDGGRPRCRAGLEGLDEIAHARNSGAGTVLSCQRLDFARVSIALTSCCSRRCSSAVPADRSLRALKKGQTTLF